MTQHGELPLFSIRLRQCRKALDYSLAEAARRLRQLSRETEDQVEAGTTAQKVWRWEHGEYPRARNRRLLCMLYNATPEQLGFRADASRGSGSTEAEMVGTGRSMWGPMHTVEDVADFTADDLTTGSSSGDPSGILSGARLTEALQPWATERPRVLRFDPPRPIGEEDVARLETVVRGLRHWEDRVRGRVRREMVVGQLAEVADLLRDRHPPAITRSLFRVLAELAEIAASMSYDAGAQATAQQYFLYALRAAHNAREPSFGGCVLGDMARQMLDLRRPEDALDLVRLALDGVGPSAPGRLRAMLRTREAWACATTGKVQAFHRAVGIAEEEFTDEGDDEPYRGARFDAAELNGVIGARYRDLARHDARQAARARERIHEALRLREPRELRGRIFDLIGLARTDLMLGEPEEAARAVREAIAVMDDAQSGRARRRLRDFYHESEPFDTAPIAGAREAIAERISPAYLRLSGEAVTA